jgi:hypothetical protein
MLVAVANVRLGITQAFEVNLAWLFPLFVHIHCVHPFALSCKQAL